MMGRVDIEKLRKEILNSLNPFAPKSIDKVVGFIALFFVVVYLIGLINDWSLTGMMFKDYRHWDMSILEYMAPMVILPFGIWGLWRFKNYGWIIITLYLVYLIISGLTTVALDVKWAMPHNDVTNTGPISIQYVTNSFGKIFGMKPASYYIAQVLLYGYILLYINNRTVINKFKISNKARWFTIGVIGIPFLLYGINIVLE